MSVKFGPSGNSEIFYEQGYKSSTQAPKWLREIGLDAYEYQCNKGCKIGMEAAQKLKKEAEENNIFLSIHAPYYINLASQEPDKLEGSIRYIIETLTVAKNIGATRIVVHPGACSKIERELALHTAKITLKKAMDQAKDMMLDQIHICPESMGKINQLGTLDEVIELCRLDDFLLPTIDFGHVHARGMGCLNKIEDYEQVFDQIENGLGIDRLKSFHIHYSRIEFTNGGEKKHWCYSDTQYGPEFEPLAEIIYKKGLNPVIICESRGTMAQDALELKNIYLGMGK